MQKGQTLSDRDEEKEEFLRSLKEAEERVTLAEIGSFQREDVLRALELYRYLQTKLKELPSLDSYISPVLSQLRLYFDSLVSVNHTRDLCNTHPNARRRVPELFRIYLEQGVISFVRCVLDDLRARGSPEDSQYLDSSFPEILHDHHGLRRWTDQELLPVLLEANARYKGKKMGKHDLYALHGRLGNEAL